MRIRGAVLEETGRLHRDGERVHHHLGVSGFATDAVVDARSVVAVDDDVPPHVAAVLGCAVLTGGGAVLNAGRPAAGRSVVVVGLGGVGMAAVLTALALDDVRVVAVDTAQGKLALARSWGAHDALTPAEALAQSVRGDVVVEAADEVNRGMDDLAGGRAVRQVIRL